MPLNKETKPNQTIYLQLEGEQVPFPKYLFEV